MNRRPLFGSRLYNQIVYPLLAASIVVGVVATLVAVYFLSDLTNKWVEQIALSSLSNIVTRYDSNAAQLERVVTFAAHDPTLVRAAAERDVEALAADLTAQNNTLGFDYMMVLDERGAVVAYAGSGDSAIGERPFGDRGDFDFGEAHVGLYTLRGKTTLSATSPIVSNGATYTLTASEFVDDDFLATLGGNDDSAFCYYDSAGRRIACSIGSRLSERLKRALEEATHIPSPAILRAIDEARLKGVGRESLSLGGLGFEVRAQRVSLPKEKGPRASAFLVGIVSQSVSEEASRTTTNLIMMWSIVAVIALVGLGGWVARRVSDPLVELAAGARRIADGDFETKVSVAGNNEISELAETFNQMTDSLRERSETLTKKVLELATLYEMSRALGSTLDLDDLLGSVLDSALRIFDLDLGYIALRERDSGTVGIRAVRATDLSSTDGALRSSMSEWVVREGRPLIFNPDTGTRSPQIDTVTGAKAALCVPLISTDGTIGSVTIGSSDCEYRFNSDDVRLLSTIANHVTIAIGNIELFTSLQEAYLATVRSLAAAVDAKDSYTRGHSDRVATYATMIAERMGLAHEQRIALEMAAYLHDIGKIGVKEEILLKPGRLDDGEMAQMRHHPLIGANILKPVAFPWAITPVVRHHHESFDGTGYPAGLRGDEIPLLARILTVADSYEAMTADRPYRTGRSASEAIEELRHCAGTQFDPRIVEVFAKVIEELEYETDQPRADSGDEVMPEETRAIFSALVDGIFSSFRRLGGPRLASNVEGEVDRFVAAENMPFRIVRGRVSFTDDPPAVTDGELEQMRTTLRRIDAVMARVSGITLVEHFYSDSLEGLSGRMRYLARTLDFYGDS